MDSDTDSDSDSDNDTDSSSATNSETSSPVAVGVKRAIDAVDAVDAAASVPNSFARKRASLRKAQKKMESEKEKLWKQYREIGIAQLHSRESLRFREKIRDVEKDIKKAKDEDESYQWLDTLASLDTYDCVLLDTLIDMPCVKHVLALCGGADENQKHIFKKHAPVIADLKKRYEFTRCSVTYTFVTSRYKERNEYVKFKPNPENVFMDDPGSDCDIRDFELSFVHLPGITGTWNVENSFRDYKHVTITGTRVRTIKRHPIVAITKARAAPMVNPNSVALETLASAQESHMNKLRVLDNAGSLLDAKYEKAKQAAEKTMGDKIEAHLRTVTWQNIPDDIYHARHMRNLGWLSALATYTKGTYIILRDSCSMRVEDDWLAMDISDACSGKKSWRLDGHNEVYQKIGERFNCAPCRVSYAFTSKLCADKDSPVQWNDPPEITMDCNGSASDIISGIDLAAPLLYATPHFANEEDGSGVRASVTIHVNAIIVTRKI